MTNLTQERNETAMNADHHNNSKTVENPENKAGNYSDPCRSTANVFYQTSMMTALLDGVFEGSMTLGELMEHGDFGIGTFEHLDGELIAFDNHYYRLLSDGSVHKVSEEVKTPFASVTFFKPDEALLIDKPIGREELEHKLNAIMPSENLFYAIRIDGVFEKVSTRTVKGQKPPYPTLVEATQHLPIHTMNQVSGTLVGFKAPDYAQGLAVAGYHVHFVDDELTGGGHVLDYRLVKGTIQIGIHHEMHIHFPNNRAFLKADLLRENLDGEMGIAEG